MPEYAMTIGGKPVATTDTFGVADPSTGETFATAPACDEDTLDAAVHAAADAFGSWRDDEPARRRCLAEAATALREHADELAALLTREQGKPLRESTMEVGRAATRFQYFADLDLPPEVLEDTDDWRVEVHRRPIGPVAALVPWNLPVQLAAAKIVPALRAGNTVVLKPSPDTPLTGLALGRILAGVFPPGVLNVVTGPVPLGRWLVTHPGIRTITFTGSVATGKSVAAAAGPDLKRLTLELGGNDPAIVLDDADPERVADGILWPAFANCGQMCMGIKRVYVPDALHDAVVAALAARAGALVVGAGTEPDSQLGPLATAAQHERVTGLVADALSRGARAATGGHPLERPGWFHAPTVLADADDGMPIVDEEQFGPALPVVRYRDVDDAVRRANDSRYGLTASVWSTDPRRAAAVARRLECGTAWVNTHIRLSFTEPFAGTKDSGLGTTGGVWGIYGTTEPFVLHVPKA